MRVLLSREVLAHVLHYADAALFAIFEPLVSCINNASAKGVACSSQFASRLQAIS
jgi:hypothetical protein